MRMDKYKNICDNVQISEQVLTGYQIAINQIKAENGRAFDECREGQIPRSLLRGI